MPQVEVALPGSSYSIRIGPGLLSRLGPAVRELEAAAGRRWSARVAVVTHPELPASYAETVCGSLRDAGFDPGVAHVPRGEASKSLPALAELYDCFAAMRLDRQSLVVALGGGVIGDLGGFAAATYLRGLALVQVPTTLLAQVDASIGGKTAIDLPAGKNLVGAFHQPCLVIADTTTLATLPPGELRSGLAEVVKYGVIWDAELFACLEQDGDRIRRAEPETLTRLVVRSCEIKAEVVRQDPHELGLRAILNYGHTVGHALEAVSGYGVVPHGEAVAIGMSAAGRLAVRLGILEPAAAARQDALLRHLGLPTLSLPEGDRLPDPIDLPPVEDLLNAMMLDKKVVAGRLRFVLPRAIGTVELREVEAVDVAAVLRAA